MRIFGSQFNLGVHNMPWGTDDEVVSSQALSLVEAMALAAEQPADPTIAIEPVIAPGKDGRMYLNVAIPLDVHEKDCRIKKQVLKTAGVKVKCNISTVGVLPMGSTARITDKDGHVTEFAIKNTSPIRVSLGMELRGGKAVAPKTAKAGN